jgi:ATP-dependent DNA helicase DinG
MTSGEKLDQIFGPDGAIARTHPQYEFRPDQIQMAQAVQTALEERHHLCVEAGTGTGKTLAYLVPCILSNRRVVISTGTKNLQEQLFFKDVPFLEKALGGKLSVCYVKGRSNYLCLKKLEALSEETYLIPPRDSGSLKLIKKWARVTETGDRAELKELPEDLELWQHLDARRETCTGQKCPSFETCFVTKVRQRAFESNLVIVNHYLFFADLALRQGDFGSVLPDYSVVVFDEAHEIEDVSTQYFGVMVSNYRLEELVRDAESYLRQSDDSPAHLREQPAQVAHRTGAFFHHFIGKEGRFPMAEFGRGLPLRRGPQSAPALGEDYQALVASLAVFATSLANLPGSDDSVEALSRRAAELRNELAAIMESDSPDHVYWYEGRGRGTFLWASPVRIGTLLKERLFDKTDSVVLTSATLSTGGTFQFIRSRLCLEQSGELILGSHFDFAQQAILYVPKHIPEPREEGWARQACLELERILQASQGRAFVLFTSYSQMELLYQTLHNKLPYPMLMQGQMSKAGLLESFRKTPGAVLFATSSFWQGVDVQGDQLSCVVIDKLPFSVPSDPVVAARIRYLNESGGNAFYEYQIPEAIILLKQGLGRLIRSRTDRGILAILDKRVLTKSYGRTFLHSLPPAPLTTDWRDLSSFFADNKETGPPE